jgi:DNA-binding NtrC family response regulator
MPVVEALLLSRFAKQSFADKHSQRDVGNEKEKYQLATHYQLPPPQYTHKTVRILENYEWHGNIRELRNFCERMVIFHSGKLIEPEHLPLEWQSPQVSLVNCLPQLALPEGGLNLVELEIALIRQALNRTQGNRSQAARLLGLTRDTLLYRMKKYRGIL